MHLGASNFLLSPFFFPMNPLFEFLRKYNNLLLFIVLEYVSLSLLIRFNSFQGSVWSTGANAMVAGVDRWSLDFWSYVNLGNVNRQLTERNVQLMLENNQLREAMMTLKHDTTEVERAMMRNLVDYELIAAKVISNSKGTKDNYLVIDRGSRHGVKEKMGVVSGNGAVGVVYLVGAEHSVVIPVTNHKSSISCRIQGQNHFGYLQWDGKSMRRAFLDEIPRHAQVEKGGVVETSGHSFVFPPGIFVGKIDKIDDSADGQSYKLDINLGTDFSNLREVEVIVTPYREAIDSLFSKINTN